MLIILKETNIIQSLAQKIDCMYAAERCTSNQNQANNILGDKTIILKCTWNKMSPMRTGSVSNPKLRNRSVEFRTSVYPPNWRRVRIYTIISKHQ